MKINPESNWLSLSNNSKYFKGDCGESYCWENDQKHCFSFSEFLSRSLVFNSDLEFIVLNFRSKW
jgi:hypothetical protein